MPNNTKYDVAIIGAGPAGMMAAIKAAEKGARVILLEKNKGLGFKLLFTGNGRCNITNQKNESREFLERFGKKGKFLFSSLHKFGVCDLMDFFESYGVPLKVEQDEKVFPQSGKARDILNVLFDCLCVLKVEIKTNCEARKIITEKSLIKKLILANGTEIFADKFIISTGGKSFPATGSTGDGYLWASELGHTIVEPVPALSPIVLQDNFVKELQGLSYANIGVSIYRNENKIYSSFGDIIFTDIGISGPAIMDMSRQIAREDLRKIKIKIDFFPAFALTEIDKMIREEFQKDSNKLFKNCLSGKVPQRMLAVISELLKIDQSQKANLITKEQRKKLSLLLKEFSLKPHSISGFERAYITSGGISLNEVEPKTMQSKLISNLYFAGEILDLDGPSGGYNLQACWTTGYAAGCRD